MPLHPRHRCTLLLLIVAALPLAAQTTNNDSSCDISVTPAATLLLPYFEVDLASPPAKAMTTLFTVVNTSAQPQIARATIWSDWAYPVMSFDLFLTGYDVTSVNLYDVLHGRLPEPAVGNAGAHSAANWANINHSPTVVSDCSIRPASIAPALLAEARSVLTTGQPAGGPLTCVDPATARPARLGWNFLTSAHGYVTIDVVSTCSPTMPQDARYFTSELLYDNVLTGDWMQLSPGTSTGNFAGGSPLVHIRAVPEGGPAGTAVATPLPYTFYGRLLSHRAEAERRRDRRQPLPSSFATRYISAGLGSFNTRLTIWREAVTGADASCADYVKNSDLHVADIVRFDEHENATVRRAEIYIFPPQYWGGVPAASSLPDHSSTFPWLRSPNGDVAGWIYLNLARHAAFFFGGSGPPSPGAGQSQGWVVTTLYAEGRYATSYDATPLTNGCSPIRAPGATIGPETER